jgi:hypothetical protein
LAPLSACPQTWPRSRIVHAIAVADALGVVLPRLLDAPPAKLVPLLRLLDELLASSGAGLAEVARPTLERLARGGASHAARLAPSILSRARLG